MRSQKLKMFREGTVWLAVMALGASAGDHRPPTIIL